MRRSRKTAHDPRAEHQECVAERKQHRVDQQTEKEPPGLHAISEEHDALADRSAEARNQDDQNGDQAVVIGYTGDERVAVKRKDARKRLP